MTIPVIVQSTLPSTENVLNHSTHSTMIQIQTTSIWLLTADPG